ncbi:HutD/Ves family protein [Sphingomonas sp. ERG5]|uniref:HutD/Ves family protein n=1 Tax=Sphingomonas sp. ERG5 TaxID=1381597 RepID=UPI00068B4C61|nr:HutD family protein [Sphingomonas sp. ERG5]
MKHDILRAADRVARPWKNGGGVTRDICTFPAGSTMDDFDWRLSMAEVREAGPFSSFADIDRTLMVLQGRLELDFGAGEPVTLTPETAAHPFPGDVAVNGKPVDGPVTDLNLMVRRGLFTGAIRHQPAGTIRIAADLAAVHVLIATSDMEIRCGATASRLDRFDALLMGAGSGEDQMLDVTGSGLLIAIRPA